MNVSSDKCQLSIKSGERKVLPPKVVKGTPSQTEPKVKSSLAAKYTVFSQCLSFRKAIPSASLLKSRTCWKELLKSSAQCPHHINEESKAKSRGNFVVRMGQKSQSYTYWLLYWYTHIRSFYLKQRWVNFPLKGQIVNTLDFQATGSLLQLPDPYIAVARSSPKQYLTNGCGYVSKKFIYRNRLASWIWLMDHKLPSADLNHWISAVAGLAALAASRTC